jgi:hypothetical protein
MSNQLGIERIMEPRLVINSDNRYIALIGASNVNYRTIPAPTVSQNALVWTTIDPPNGARSIIGRKLYITVRVQMNFTAAAGENTTNILQAGTDGLRAYPFSSCISNLQAQLNGQSITTSFLSDTIHARSRYFNHHAKSLNLSESAAMKDRTQEYSDLYMGVNHPLSNLGDSGLFAGETRGVITRMTITENSPTSAQLDLFVSEPVILFPFEFATNSNETGISQVERMTMDIQFSHLNRMWCHDFTKGSQIDSMDTTLLEAYLHINYLTPPNGYQLPPICVLPFDEFQPTPTDIGVFKPGEEKQTSSTVIQFGSVPQQLFIFAKMSNSDRYSNLQNEIGSTDTFAQISNITVNYDNQAGILSEAQPIQLYQACVANGIQDSYAEFLGEVNDGFAVNGVDPTTQFPTGKIGLTGTVIRLMFGKDIAASGSLIPGLLGRSSFIIRATVKNVNYHKEMSYDLWVVPVYEGLVSFSGGSGRKEIAPLMSTELVASAPISGVSYTAYETAYGGSFLDVIGKIAKGVGSVLGMIPTPITQAIGVGAKAIGSLMDKKHSSSPASPQIAPNTPMVQVAAPSQLTPQIETLGSPVGAPVAVMPNPYAFPPHSANVPVGAPVPQVYIDPAFQGYPYQGYPYQGRGVVGQGLVNATVKGGKLASMSRLRRQF